MNAAQINVAVISGGSGGYFLSSACALLEKMFPGTFKRLTIIQSPYDNGGDSGELQRIHGIWPGVGDPRKVIWALTKLWADKSLRDLNHRAVSVNGRPGQSYGNSLFIPIMRNYLHEPDHGLVRAIEHISSQYGMKKCFKVLPASLDRGVLAAELKNGQHIIGQANITRHQDYQDTRIVRMYFHPQGTPRPPRLNPAAEKALKNADLIIINSGSFRTSIKPPFLLERTGEILNQVSAKIFMVLNVITTTTETQQWTAMDFVSDVVEVIKRPLDCVFCSRLGLKSENGRFNYPQHILEDILQKHERNEFFVVSAKEGIPSSHANDVQVGNYVDWIDGTFRHNPKIMRDIIDYYHHM